MLPVPKGLRARIRASTFASPSLYGMRGFDPADERMREPARLRIVGRFAAFLGALGLLASLYYPWIGITGNQTSLPAMDYAPVQIVNLASTLTGIPLAVPFYLWLFLVAAGAFVCAIAGRRARNLGSSAIMVVVLLAFLVWLAVFTANTRNTIARADFAADWGIVLAVASAIVLEVGLRTTRPTRARVTRPLYAEVQAPDESEGES